MRRLIVSVGDDKHVNIECERIESDGTVVQAWVRNHIVGMFLIGSFDFMYLSETKEKPNDI